MVENYYDKREREAGERLATMLSLPMPETEHDIGVEGVFEPWDLFPELYGSYGEDFDKCAIEVLSEINDRKKVRSDLGAEMFREMLCTAGFCDYGTSPRVCFPSQSFAGMLPALIEKWKAHSLVQWDEDVCADEETL